MKLANHLDIETQDVAAALHIHPFMLSRWKKEYREGRWKGSGHPDLKEINDREATMAEYKGILGLEAALKRAHIVNDL